MDSTERSRYRRNEWGILIVGFVVCMALTAALYLPALGGSARAVSGQSAELYVIRDGKRIVLDHWSAPDDGKMHPRLVSLHYCGCWGPSAGSGPDSKLFGVTYHRWWANGSAYYDQQYTGWWFLGAVKPQYRAQYVTGCTANGISPAACSEYGRSVVHWNQTRTTQNDMWQWNYTGVVAVELNAKISGPWIEAWVGEMHMLANGTMWWDAFRQSLTEPVHCDLNCGP